MYITSISALAVIFLQNCEKKAFFVWKVKVDIWQIKFLADEKKQKIKT